MSNHIILWVFLFFLSLPISCTGMYYYIDTREDISEENIKFFKLLYLIFVLITLFLTALLICMVLHKYFHFSFHEVRTTFFGSIPRYNTVVFCVIVLLVPILAMLVPFYYKTSTREYESDTEDKVSKAELFTWLKLSVILIFTCWMVALYFHFM